MKVKIITDSASDISEELMQSLDVTVVPSTITFGDQSYKVGEDLDTDAFYEKLTTCEFHPQTAQPAPALFKAIFEENLKSYDHILGIFISDKMSGTMQSAQMAKDEMMSAQITLVNSHTVSSGLTLLIQKARELLNSGKSVDEVVQVICDLRDQVSLFFVLDTLKYLEKGGRIGKAQALLGGILNVKPILTLSEGQVAPFDKARGTKKANAIILNKLKEVVSVKPEGVKAMIGHSLSSEELSSLLSKIDEFYDHSKLNALRIGPAVGTHAGPGLFSIGWIID